MVFIDAIHYSVRREQRNPEAGGLCDAGEYLRGQKVVLFI